MNKKLMFVSIALLGFVLLLGVQTVSAHHYNDNYYSHTVRESPNSYYEKTVDRNHYGSEVHVTKYNYDRYHGYYNYPRYGYTSSYSYPKYGYNYKSYYTPSHNYWNHGYTRPYVISYTYRY